MMTLPHHHSPVFFSQNREDRRWLLAAGSSFVNLELLPSKFSPNYLLLSWVVVLQSSFFPFFSFLELDFILFWTTSQKGVLIPLQHHPFFSSLLLSLCPMCEEGNMWWLFEMITTIIIQVHYSQRVPWWVSWRLLCWCILMVIIMTCFMLAFPDVLFFFFAHHIMLMIIWQQTLVSWQ